MSDRELMRQALEALEYFIQSNGIVRSYEKSGARNSAEALRARLAEPQTCKPALQVEGAEAVAVVGTQADVWRGCNGQWTPPGPPMKTVYMLRDLPDGTSLYTAPPARRPLTDEEIDAMWRETVNRRDIETTAALTRAFARAAITKAEGARHD